MMGSLLAAVVALLRPSSSCRAPGRSEDASAGWRCPSASLLGW